MDDFGEDAIWFASLLLPNELADCLVKPWV
jgi:hypothetical protein